VEEIKRSLSASVYCTDLYFFTCCRPPYTVRFLCAFNGTINLTPPSDVGGSWNFISKRR